MLYSSKIIGAYERAALRIDSDEQSFSMHCAAFLALHEMQITVVAQRAHSPTRCPLCNMTVTFIY